MNDENTLFPRLFGDFDLFALGFDFVPTKIALEYLSSPLQLAGCTYLIAGIVLMPWAGIGPRYFRRENGSLAVKVALFSTTILYGAYYLGQNLLTPRWRR